MAGESLCEHQRAVIPQHPLSELVQHFGIVQFTACGHIGQKLIGHAAPQEIGEARCKRVSIERPFAAGIVLRLGAEQKKWGNQRHAHSGENRFFKRMPLFLNRVEQVEVRLDIGRGHRTPECAREEVQKYDLRCLVDGDARPRFGDEQFGAGLVFLGCEIHRKTGCVEIFFGEQR